MNDRSKKKNNTKSPKGASAPEAGLSGAADDTLRQVRAQLAALSGGLAPDDYAQAWWDWYLNLATQPARQTQLARSAYEKTLDSWQFFARAAAGEPLAPGHENLGFATAAWNVWPFNAYARAYGNWASWWQQALQPTEGKDVAALARANFAGRMLLEAASPANFLQTNPELLQRTAAESGRNLMRGLKNWLEDAARAVEGGRAAGTEEFGSATVAVTPGKVVLRNELIELIQYSPQSATVHAEPILITPAWIMKYYILDLSPGNSLVKFLVERGHTVFMMSWKNPDGRGPQPGHGRLRATGPARGARRRDRDRARRNACTRSATASAARCCDRRGRAGRAKATSASPRSRCSPRRRTSASRANCRYSFPPTSWPCSRRKMQRDGVLSSEHGRGVRVAARQRSDLGARWSTNTCADSAPLNDLMAWNADGTRMPCRMHSEYLYRLYLHNELSAGRYTVDGAPRRIWQASRCRCSWSAPKPITWRRGRSVFKTRALTRSARTTPSC